MKIPLKDVIVQDRQRRSYTNIQELCESLQSHGLIEPIVVNQDNRLVAGGRRLKAATLLNWPVIEARVIETRDEEHLQELELVENLDREDLTWQERCMAVARLHYLKVKQNALAGEEWTQIQTGKMIGVSMSHVSICTTIAALLEEGDLEVTKCEGVTEAVKLLAQRRIDDLNKELAVRSTPIVPKRKFTWVDDGRGIGMMVAKYENGKPADSSEEDQAVVTIPLSTMLLCGDCKFLMTTLDSKSIDHIVTDPPYGIDMEMLAQGGGTQEQEIDRVRAEHQMDENLHLLKAFLYDSYRVLKDRGFLVLWCDIMNWGFLYTHAREAGFRVQRWPLYWDKLHTCANAAAQYNFTKTIEFAMVCRKEGTVLAMPATRCGISVAKPREGPQHPFFKPLELWDFILQHISIQGQTILDPFAGEGSCVLACLKTGRIPLAFEIEDRHYNQMLENVKAFYATVHEKVNYE